MLRPESAYAFEQVGQFHDLGVFLFHRAGLQCVIDAGVRMCAQQQRFAGWKNSESNS